MTARKWRVTERYSYGWIGFWVTMLLCTASFGFGLVLAQEPSVLSLDSSAPDCTVLAITYSSEYEGAFGQWDEDEAERVVLDIDCARQTWPNAEIEIRE